MKIYTRTGDKGSTSLIGGTRVPKTHPRLEAYGTIDELMAHVGVLYDIAPTLQDRECLHKILNYLMDSAAILAADESAPIEKRVQLPEKAILLLEEEIDRITPTLPALTRFILPCGHPSVSQAHIARTVCRRAERNIIKLTDSYEIDNHVLQFINRLSDFLFVLARYWAKECNAPEIYWEPEL